MNITNLLSAALLFISIGTISYGSTDVLLVQGGYLGLVQRTLATQKYVGQIASVSVWSERSMLKGLFCKDVGTLEMCEHLLGHQKPRNCS